MELSYFLAQLFGLSLAIFAAAMFNRPADVRGMIQEVGQSQLLTVFASFAGIMGGLAVILTHNVWVLSWPVVITLFGWASLVKGVTYLVAPQKLAALGDKVYHTNHGTKAVLLLAFFFGVYLACLGFGII